MSQLFLNQTYLFTPGPTPIPNQVNTAMARPMIGHRSPDFSILIEDVATRLQPIFGTKHPVMILTSSGTSALEAAVVNTIHEGDHAVVIVAGSFGDRLASIAENYGATVHRLNIEWGKSCSPEQLAAFIDTLEGTPVKAVFGTFNETSTGVLNPIHALGKVVKEKTGALFIVDGVSCIGAVPVDMESDHIDILVTSSQKALMLPPGLAFAAFSDRGLKAIRECPERRFYLDLKRYVDTYEKQKSTPFTPAVSLIQGAQAVCDMIEEEGWNNVVKRHVLLRDMMRAGIRELGLPLLTTEEDASPTVTAVKPEGISAPDIQKALKKNFSITIAGGQKDLKGKIFRIGHMGYCTPFDILKVLSALELTLAKFGQAPRFGAAVRKAEEVYAENV
ncbi:alanine--glyoxylate aminotransferase family protein [Sporolactobacillus shoreicorticis]|uniref:Pyridoxal-phosphate-dependent aminotransferase family protein n=1 Tax=Sporolactobacillus shoreicorticis TaxID=1923877 RepID=A0ABW5S9F9_9BACL|nr:alanine--glyoxylate aminotransferase family protein [Sporolactobacillus shoreicorticis]MCO7127276.1 alanine--glyoxylate aminotransferase family protein [Sporolactobacillus shoreicorticis]